ncbi:bck1-like resistance to osmotic shock [Sorochytrium milnesiophthora]
MSANAAAAAMLAGPMPMLHVPLKSTDEVEWAQAISAYIQEAYADDPEKYKDAIQTLYKLRQDVRGVGSDATGRDLLLRYYGQLELLDLRFPVDEQHVKVVFTWHDAYNAKATSQHSIAYEKACVIFNIGAALSHMAASAPRIDPDGVKRAYHNFQIAAGIFQFINDNFLHAPSTDLSREVVKALSSLMLAQAQEVFLEKTLADKKRSNVVVKLTAALANMYSSLNDAVVGDEKLKNYFDSNRYLQTMIQAKAKYFVAFSQYQKGLQCEADGKHGECVSRLTLAEKEAKEAFKLAGNFNSSFNNSTTVTAADAGTAIFENAKTLQANVTDQKAKAIKDNDIIYHETIPNADTLSALEKLVAPKLLGFADIFPGGAQDLQRLVGPDIFASLIPLAVHEKASMYSEEKAKILRVQSEALDTVETEVTSALESMGLPAALEKFRNSVSDASKHAEPPRRVLDAAREVAYDESNAQTAALVSTLEGARSRDTRELDELTMELDREHQECEAQRSQFGALWTQSASSAADEKLRAAIRSHRQAYEQASSSDTMLLSKIRELQSDIDVLKAGPDAVAQFYAEQVANAASGIQGASSRAAAPAASLLDIEPTETEKPLSAIVQQLTDHIASLHKLKKERQAIYANLKEKVHADDISDLLVLNKKNNADKFLFETELQKFAPSITSINGNIETTRQRVIAISSIWSALQSHKDASNIRVASSVIERKMSELTNRLIESGKVYLDVKNGLRKGIDFYLDLSSAVEETKKAVTSYRAERTRERQRLVTTLESTRAEREQRLLREQLARLQMGTSSSPAPAFSPTPASPASVPFSPTGPQRSFSQEQPLQPQHTGSYYQPPPTQYTSLPRQSTAPPLTSSAPSAPYIPPRPVAAAPSPAPYAPTYAQPQPPYGYAAPPPAQSSYTTQPPAVAPQYTGAPPYAHPPQQAPPSMLPQQPQASAYHHYAPAQPYSPPQGYAPPVAAAQHAPPPANQWGTAPQPYAAYQAAPQQQQPVYGQPPPQGYYQQPAAYRAPPPPQQQQPYYGQQYGQPAPQQYSHQPPQQPQQSGHQASLLD